jgi:hypothetical protein
MSINFDYIADAHSRSMILNGYLAAQRLELGDWFKTWEPEANRGFMFSRHPNIDKFIREIDSDGHSGCSFAWVCRNLQAYYNDPVKFKEGWVSS